MAWRDVPLSRWLRAVGIAAAPLALAFIVLTALGLLAGIDLEPHPAPGIRGYEALNRLYEKGLMVKMTGDCVLLSPPLIISESEIDFMIDTLREVFEGL